MAYTTKRSVLAFHISAENRHDASESRKLFVNNEPLMELPIILGQFFLEWLNIYKKLGVIDAKGDFFQENKS